MSKRKQNRMKGDRICLDHFQKKYDMKIRKASHSLVREGKGGS